ncbi:hypothetical protein V8F20_002793 [Naviculisporaceae sp. PSN 640]
MQFLDSQTTMTEPSTTRQQAATGTGAKSHYYGPVSLSILSDFLEDDDDNVLPNPGLQRPSSTVAVVDGGGSDRSTPPLPLGGGFRGYKPVSRDVVRALFDRDGEGEGDTGTTQSGIQKQTRGYQPPSKALLGGFSDDEEEDDEWWEDGVDTYTTGGSGSRGIPLPPSKASQSKTAKDKDRSVDTRDGNKTGAPLIDLSDRGAAIVESRQTDIGAAFRRNQANVAPSDLSGYFAPEDFSFGRRYQVAATITTTTMTTTRASALPSNIIKTNPRTLLTPNDGEYSRECIVCTEELPIATSFPSASITTSCTHPPSTCLDCIATSIRTDLNTKLWNEIRCPECLATLQYDDVQRFADEQTKERYQTLSFRYVVSEADNFLWCTKGCGYGQVHDGGNENPIVVCMLCNARSCFYHKSVWHENLSCEEYDALQQDPLNFRSRYEMENEAAEEEMRRRRMQEDADRAFAQSLLDEETRERERERLEQERKERERKERQERERREKKGMELRKQRELAAKRKKEEEASVKKIGMTTKPCPKCEAPIEKNKGCSHMTCTRCGFHFCWDCGADYYLPDGRSHPNYCKGYV